MNTTAPSEPLQPLLFAPPELRACGLRAAHPFPLVGRRSPDGIESWRMPASDRAWAYPLIELTRAGSCFAGVGFDCDSREAVELAASSCMGAGDLPTPNICATRTASGHTQVFYLLDRPVHRGEHARAKPLQYLARVSEYYRATFGADAGYRGRPERATRSTATTRPATPALSRTPWTSSPGRFRRGGGHRESRRRQRVGTSHCSSNSASCRSDARMTGC